MTTYLKGNLRPIVVGRGCLNYAGVVSLDSGEASLGAASIIDRDCEFTSIERFKSPRLHATRIGLSQALQQWVSSATQLESDG